MKFSKDPYALLQKYTIAFTSEDGSQKTSFEMCMKNPSQVRSMIRSDINAKSGTYVVRFSDQDDRHEEYLLKFTVGMDNV